jgi:hypothetical protein
MFSQDWGYIASRLWQFVNETPIAEPHDGCCERRASARLLDLGRQRIEGRRGIDAVLSKHKRADFVDQVMHMRFLVKRIKKPRQDFLARFLWVITVGI